MKNDQDVMKLVDETGVEFALDENEQLDAGVSESSNATSDTYTYRPRIIDPSKVKPKAIDWLWPNKFQRSAMSVIAGQGGIGKSFVTCYMAAVLTRGEKWCDGTPAPRCSVLFFIGEEEIASVYVPRLLAQGADLSNIRFLDAIEELQGGNVVDDIEVTVELAHVGYIKQAILETERATGLPVGVVFIDPISEHLGEIKENDNAGMRKGTRSIRRMLKDMNVALIGVDHHNKALSLGAAMNRVTGSIAKTTMARSAWGVYPDMQNPGKLLFVPTKGNNLVDPKGLRFEIMRPDGQVVFYETGLDITGNDCEMELAKQVAETTRQQRQPEKLKEAEDWLRDFLSDGHKPAGNENDPAPGSVRYESDLAGHAWATIKRAYKSLGVIPKKELGVSFWSLPDSSQSDDSTTGQLAQNTLTENQFEQVEF